MDSYHFKNMMLTFSYFTYTVFFLSDDYEIVSDSQKSETQQILCYGIFGQRKAGKYVFNWNNNISSNVVHLDKSSYLQL